DGRDDTDELGSLVDEAREILEVEREEVAPDLLAQSEAADHDEHSERRAVQTKPAGDAFPLWNTCCPGGTHAIPRHYNGGARTCRLPPSPPTSADGGWARRRPPPSTSSIPRAASLSRERRSRRAAMWTTPSARRPPLFPAGARRRPSCARARCLRSK